MHPKILDRGIKNSTNTSRIANNLTGEEFRAISRGTGSSSPSENLNEIFSKFSADTKHLIFGSDYEFNFKMFDVLGDLLVHLQKSKLYEMLSTDAAPKSTSALHDLQIERIAETNIILLQVVLEKAKVQLNHLKRETLLKRLQLLSSRIQESQLIRTDLSSRSMEISTSDIRVHAVGYRSVSAYPNEGNEVCHEKLVAMRSVLEASGRKISNFNRNLHAFCKIRIEPGCGDTIALVNEYFMKRAYCRFARLDMQMWVVHSVDSMNYWHDIVLDYLDLVVQSIKVVVGPTASTSFSFEANDTYLMKVTSSLIGTLLDVFEEVQLAQIEFQNLTELSFCSPSVEQLVLKLYFLVSLPRGK